MPLGLPIVRLPSTDSPQSRLRPVDAMRCRGHGDAPVGGDEICLRPLLQSCATGWPRADRPGTRDTSRSLDPSQAARGPGVSRFRGGSTPRRAPVAGEDAGVCCTEARRARHARRARGSLCLPEQGIGAVPAQAPDGLPPGALELQAPVYALTGGGSVLEDGGERAAPSQDPRPWLFAADRCRSRSRIAAVVTVPWKA
jgi:hypothetical protein